MGILLSSLFILIALSSFCLSDHKKYRGKVKEVPFRLVAIIFGIMGFHILDGSLEASGTPEVIPTNVMYVLIVIIFGIGPEILSLAARCFLWFMKHTFWKNIKEYVKC